MTTRPDKLAMRTALAGGLLVASGLAIANLPASDPAQASHPRSAVRSSTAPPRTLAQETPPDSSPAAPTHQRPVARYGGRPLEIHIPRIDVNSAVVPISTAGGELEPPADPRTIGWWDGGARPGATFGSAVMTGHTVHTGGGALDDLDTLESGDLVRVETKAATLVYRVSSTTVYPTAAFAKQAGQIFDQAGDGRLVLITCEDWNGSTYDSNAVVVAVPTW